MVAQILREWEMVNSAKPAEAPDTVIQFALITSYLQAVSLTNSLLACAGAASFGGRLHWAVLLVGTPPRLFDRARLEVLPVSGYLAANGTR